MIKHLFLIWGLLAALTAEPVLACTSAVVSGKVTPDGRPLLWKNRDTDYLRNHVAYIKGEKYNFIADVNSANFPALKEAWMGTNSVGFALMNTQSYNLVEVKDGEERGAQPTGGLSTVPWRFVPRWRISAISSIPFPSPA